MQVRKLTHPLIAGCCVVFALIVLYPAGDNFAQDCLEGLVITEKSDLNIRSGPGTNYPVIATVPKGEKLCVAESSGAWLQIQLPDGNTGYAFHHYIHILSGYHLSKHRAGFIEVGMSVDAVYAQHTTDLIRLEDLRLEGMFTPALAIYMNRDFTQHPSIVAEIGWNNDWVVSRMIVYDERFRTACDIGVGATLGALKSCYTLDWAGFGEGPFYVRVEDLQMSFGIENTNISEDWYQTRNPNLLPDQIQITSILLN